MAITIIEYIFYVLTANIAKNVIKSYVESSSPLKVGERQYLTDFDRNQLAWLIKIPFLCDYFYIFRKNDKERA
jgi:hypothetical protein